MSGPRLALHKPRTLGPLDLSGLQMDCCDLGDNAGYVRCHPHKLRRASGPCCLRDGMDLHSIRLVMGHRPLDVLQRCLALAWENIERAHGMQSPVYMPL